MILNFLSSQVFGGPVLLDKGDKAPYEGLLFNKTEANQLRLKVLEVDMMEQQINSFERTQIQNSNIFKIQDEKLNLCVERVDGLQQNLVKSQGLNTIEKIAWVTLGVAMTGLAIYGAKQLTK